MIDNQIANLNSRIERLRKQKAKTQTQQAIHLRREAQKILKDDFTPEMALGIFSSMWGTASETQKQLWRNHGIFSHSSPVQNSPALELPTTKDELIKAYQNLCEEFLAELKKAELY